MKNLTPFWLTILAIGFGLTAFSQNPQQQARLLELAEQWRTEAQTQKAEAVRVATEKGWPIRTEDENGRITELMRLDNGKPVYYATDNAEGATLINSDELYSGGGAGLNLSGAGQTLGIWDGGDIRTTHVELVGRVTDKDGASTYGIEDHPTHVAGTMIASGIDLAAKGMSYAASLDAYDWTNDYSEMIAAAAAGLNVSQHSYGQITGWAYGHWYSSNEADPNAWHWFGDYTISETEDYFWGYYSAEAQYWDYIAQISPNYLIVKSAGNDRGEGITSGAHYAFKYSDETWVASSTERLKDGGTTGYQTVSHSATSKNVLTVGAVYNSTAMSSFSGWGPTDDGRVKPDIVAKGVNVHSSLATADDSYANWQGTSMSGPMVSGSVGLLLEHQENLHPGVKLLSSTIKGLILHTATDLGNPGPDYTYGWGLMNTEAAAAVMTEQAASPVHIYESTLNDGQSLSMQIKSAGTDPLKVTLIYTDPYGNVPTPTLNPTEANLVNDLDLRLTDPNGTVLSPYILDPANPATAATTGDNFRDNVEVIYIASPVAGAIYDLQITHKNSLSGGSQDYTLIVTGNEDFDYTYIIDGADAANNYSTEDFIAEGNNGKGFSSWYVANTNGGYLRGSAGEQGVNSATIDTDGNSFGMWADGFCDLGRLLYDNMYDGQSVSFSLAYQWDNGNRGFALNNGGWTSVEEVFYFNISSTGYSWEGGGSAASTAWSGLREFGVAMTFTFTQNGNDIDFSFSSPAGGGPSGSGTISNASFDRIKFYVSGAGGGTGANMYFNSLTFSTDIASVVLNADAIVKGDVMFDEDLTLDNLTIESGNSVTVQPAKNLTVNATIDNQAGTTALVLQSNATGTGSLLHNTDDVDITIQRYVTGDANTTNAKYHTVSVPLTAGSNPLSGIFTGAYLYNFNQGTQLYESMGTSTTTPLSVDQGYLIYYPGASTTFEFVGKANNGSFSADVSYPLVGDNYNLVPNPYPSAIDWDAASGWIKTKINNAIYIYNTSSSSSGNPLWASYVNGVAGVNGGSQYIPAGQAFFVQSNAAAPVLDMSNNVRVHNAQSFYKETKEELETLRLFAHANDYTDESVVAFKTESTTAFDGQFDALKFNNWNEAPNIYSLTADKIALSINSIPYSTESYMMELGFEWNQNGDATIEIQGIESFGDWVSIVFEDRLTGITFDLRDQNTYSFQHTADNSPERFVLYFMGVTGLEDQAVGDKQFTSWSNEGNVNVMLPAEQREVTVELFDLQGRLLRSCQNCSDNMIKFSGLTPDAIVLVRLTTATGQSTQKVFIR